MSWKDDFQRRAKEVRQGRTYSLGEPGEHTFRIMPNKRDPKKAPAIHVFMHADVGPGKEKAFLRCGKDSKGEGRCWLCDKKIPELRKLGPEKRELADSIERKEKLVLQVSPVLDGKFGKPKMFWVSVGGAKSLYPQILSILHSTKRSCEDPDRGYNTTIERIGTGIKTTWGAPVWDEEPTKVPASVLNDCKTFEDLLPQYDEKDMIAAYLGQPREEKGKQPAASASTEEETTEEYTEEAAEEYAEETTEEYTEEEIPEETSEEETYEEPEEEPEVVSRPRSSRPAVAPPRRTPAPAPTKRPSAAPAPARSAVNRPASAPVKRPAAKKR